MTTKHIFAQKRFYLLLCSKLPLEVFQFTRDKMKKKKCLWLPALISQTTGPLFSSACQHQQPTAHHKTPAVACLLVARYNFYDHLCPAVCCIPRHTYVLSLFFPGCQSCSQPEGRSWENVTNWRAILTPERNAVAN